MTDCISVSWLDLRNCNEASQLAEAFSEHYDYDLYKRYEIDQEMLYECKADLICFEYDYPDIHSLHLLQQMHVIHPDCPILMFTEQHSEALAVWAFRTGVWDYHVTPLSDAAVAEVTNSLQNARCFRCAVREQNGSVATARLPDEVRFRAPPDDKQQLQPAMTYLDIHYSEKLSEDKLAGMCNLTNSQFSRLFRKCFNITFQEYLVRYRLKESTRLLLNPIASIADVAYSVGFNDPSYYARAFKKHLGVSPSQFRQLLKDNQKVEGLTGELLNAGLSA